MAEALSGLKCVVCEDTELVAPTPFANEPRESWPAYLLRVEELHDAGGFVDRSSATFTGLIRPVTCPACDPGGPVEGKRWNVRRYRDALV